MTLCGLLSLCLCSACAKHTIPARLQYLHYEGQVNEHHIMIQAPPERIFAILTDEDRFPGLVPCDRIRVSCVTQRPYRVGTLIRTQTGFKIKISWLSKVVDLAPPRRITLQFQDGIFRGGYEVWELEPVGDQTMVSHTILYKLSNFMYRLLWSVKNVEEKHNSLVENTLHNLRRTAEIEAAAAQHPSLSSFQPREPSSAFEDGCRKMRIRSIDLFPEEHERLPQTCIHETSQYCPCDQQGKPLSHGKPHQSSKEHSSP
jgi:ribosome-associated toxin RatA of RatAB toxin-antitoxin module